jgi:hypothetical protein
MTATTSADFPDSFKIMNGDGMTIIKNPDNNEIVLQVPSANTIIYRRPNPQPTTPPDVPPSMQNNA